MTDPTPEQQPPTAKPASSNLTPSGSTGGSAVGGMLTVFILLAMRAHKVEVDAISAVAIGAGMATLGGYLTEVAQTVLDHFKRV